MAQILETTLGHAPIRAALQRAVKNQRLFPVQLFTGPAGVGKKRVALGVFQNLTCSAQPACGECVSCKKIEALTYEALLVIKTSGTQIRVEDIQRVHDFVHLKLLTPARAILIEDAHLLNAHAANSLLKVLEEPPEGTYFFLLSQLVSDILPTIRSRGQIVRFGPLAGQELAQIRNAPTWMMRAAQGSLENLEHLLSPEIADLRLTSIQLLTQKRASHFQAFKTISELKESRENVQLVARFFQQFLRDALVAKSGGNQLIHEDQSEAIQSLAQATSAKLQDLLRRAFDIEKGLYQNLDRGLLLEDFWVAAQTP